MLGTHHAALPKGVMTAADLDAARAARGFMPDAEGLLLRRAAVAAAGHGPMLEIGGYCGKSAIYIGSAARFHNGVLFSVDHHRGSEENQPGQLYCDAAVIDVRTGKVDSLPHLRRTLEAAGLENWVIAVVGSSTVARDWRMRLTLVFIDGGHTEAAAHADYTGFAGTSRPAAFWSSMTSFPTQPTAARRRCTCIAGPSATASATWPSKAACAF